MGDARRLNKALWTNITRLKLFAKGDDYVKFILEKSPFDDEKENAAAAWKEYVIIGRILPQLGIYKEIAFRIEMKLTAKYPQEPPEVRFVTPVYHPNIEEDGK
jgi:ubiquitin-protein ligase